MSYPGIYDAKALQLPESQNTSLGGNTYLYESKGGRKRRSRRSTKTNALQRLNIPIRRSSHSRNRRSRRSKIVYK